MRSSPNRICGFIRPREARTSPESRIAQVHGEGGRADVHRETVDLVVEAGADVDEPPAITDEGGCPVAARFEGRVQLPQRVRVGLRDPHPE